MSEPSNTFQSVNKGVQPILNVFIGVGGGGGSAVERAWIAVFDFVSLNGLGNN